MPYIYNNPDFDYQRMVEISNALGIGQEAFDQFLETEIAKGVFDLKKGESSISLEDYRNSTNSFCHKYDNSKECYTEFINLCMHWERVVLKNKSYRIEYPTCWEEYDKEEDAILFHPGHAIVIYHKGKKEKLYYMVNKDYD